MTDFTEQARREIDDRLLEDLAAGFIPSNELKAFKLQAYLCLEARFRSFAEQVASEAATQGQAAAFERAAEVCNKEETEAGRLGKGSMEADDVQSYFRGRAHEAEECERQIRALSPDPAYLNQVRNEAATAERNRIKETILMLHRKHDRPDFDDAFEELLAGLTAAFYVSSLKVRKGLSDYDSLP